VNVYDILRDGWRETRVDMTLQFFLDPTERHGLGPLVIDAMLRLVDGAPTIGPDGATAVAFTAADATGSDSWEVETQAQFIDVLAVNRELGVAVVIENKIDHTLNNPLRRYAQHARDQGFGTVLVVVLAPESRAHVSSDEQRYISASLTYSGLSQQIRQSPDLVDALLSPRDLDQRRSLELLQQFIEARTGGQSMSDLADESQRLDEWRALLDLHRDAIVAFESARGEIWRTIRDRRKRLEPLIAEGLERASLVPGWEAHGGSQEETWNAYHFPTADWTVELKFSADPKHPPIYVYDYRGRTYKDATIEPLGLPWTARDQEVADAFVARVTQIVELARQGRRPTPTV